MKNKECCEKVKSSINTKNKKGVGIIGKLF